MPGAAVSTRDYWTAAKGQWEVGDPWPYNPGGDSAPTPAPHPVSGGGQGNTAAQQASGGQGNAAAQQANLNPGIISGGVVISEVRLKALLRFAPKWLRVEVLTEIGRAP